MEREIIYLSLHCHHHNDSCIKMGSDESHFNVSLIIVKDKVTRQCTQTTTFRKERRAIAESTRGPSAYQLNALPLGQTGSRTIGGFPYPHVPVPVPVTHTPLPVPNKPYMPYADVKHHNSLCVVQN